MSRAAPPPLPGGYKVGEKVFFTGASQTVSTGDKVVHGQQGEVTGPATVESVKGKGVIVRFPGNKGNVCCFLTEVRCLRAASAATLRLRPRHAMLLTHRAPALPSSTWLCPDPTPVASHRGPAPREGLWLSRMARGGGSAGEGPGQSSLGFCWMCAGEPQCAAGAA